MYVLRFVGNNLNMEKNKDNVIEFHKKDELSESEINSLFLGLVRLIKKSAEKSIEKTLKRECAFATKMANSCKKN